MSAHRLDDLYERLLKTNKSLVVAPAGFGKTHMIALVAQLTEDRILVLTHTNAGVASIRQKLRQESVGNCQVETIAGYARKYVHAYTDPQEIPPQSDTKKYYPYIYDRFLKLLAKDHIKRTLTATYNHVIVDEYQDCETDQHKLILKLGSILYVHALGDGLQSIFGFNSKNRLNWSDVKRDLQEIGELRVPFRWRINGGNKKLGDQIYKIREKLEKRHPIDLLEYNEVEFVQCGERSQKFFSELRKYCAEETNLLIIDPKSHSRHSRVEVIQRLSKVNLRMIESIDEKKFYQLAEKVDKMRNPESEIYTSLRHLAVNKTEGLFWGLGELLKNKLPTNTNNLFFQPILKNIRELVNDFNLHLLKEVLVGLKELSCSRVRSDDQYYSLVRAISIASDERIPVSDAMVKVRNRERSTGRLLRGRAIGTTLLTKGLEVDTVLIINSEEFKDPNNFYVAISRAVKCLIIFGKQPLLKPY